MPNDTSGGRLPQALRNVPTERFIEALELAAIDIDGLMRDHAVP